MTERKYSVAEIDRMRRAIEYQFVWGCKIGEMPKYDCVVSRSYRSEEKDRAVEERLRTYMLAGVEPEELE